MWADNMMMIAAATVNTNRALLAAGIVILVAAGVFLVRNFPKYGERKEGDDQWKDEHKEK